MGPGGRKSSASMKSASLLFSVLLTGGAVQAAEIPVWPAHWMCAEADGIVLGERIGPNRVKVLEWLLPPTDGEVPRKDLEIVGLDQHTRVVRPNPGPRNESPEKALKTRRLICFLERKGVAWYSMSALGAGSSGLVWIEAGKCFRYEQIMNPGPLVLMAYHHYATEKLLRDEILRGIADRKAWEETLGIVHPEEKAIILSSYLLARTSPEDDRGTYRQRVRQVLPKLGRNAVGELIELLRTAQPGDQLGEAILVLNDLGTMARPAVPHLLPLLKQPGQVHPVRVLGALGRIGDASVAPQVLPFLGNKELEVRAEAAKTLASFRYQDAAPAIAGALPKVVAEGGVYHVYAMLAALKELDSRRAGELTRKYIDQPAMKHFRNLLEPLLQE